MTPVGFSGCDSSSMPVMSGLEPPEPVIEEVTDPQEGDVLVAVLMPPATQP